MRSFTLSVSGEKDRALGQARAQIADDEAFDWVAKLIEGAPGAFVSLSGSLNVSEDGSHGSISLSGSFWSS